MKMKNHPVQQERNLRLLNLTMEQLEYSGSSIVRHERVRIQEQKESPSRIREADRE